MDKNLQITRSLLAQLRDHSAFNNTHGAQGRIVLQSLIKQAYINQEVRNPLTAEDGLIYGYLITDKGREYLTSLEAQ